MVQHTPRPSDYKKEAFSAVQKLIAIFLSLSLILSESFAYGQTIQIADTRPQAADNAAAVLSIPAELGHVEEAYFQHTSSRQSASGFSSAVIYIQDAHDSVEAQKNIARIIRYLVARYGVKTVLEEGYEGPVPTEDYFGFIQDAAVKRKVAGVFMDRLMLGGAEYAHINRDRDFDLVGADDAKLFTENIEWYREAAKEKDQTAAELADLQEHIGRLAGRRFPTALKKWMKLRDKFDKGLLNLPDYVRQFSRIEAPLAGSHMEMLLRALNSAGPESLRTAEEIDPKKLFLEIEEAENRLAFEQLQHDVQKEIFRAYREIRLVGRLNNIEMTYDEFAAVRPALDTLRTSGIAELMVRETGKSVVLSKRWERVIGRAVRFYELARARERAVEKSLEFWVGSRENFSGDFTQDTRRRTRGNVVLVFGGFHKGSLTEMFKKNGYNYIVITPRMTEVDMKHQALYRRLMTAGLPDFNSLPGPANAARFVPVFGAEYLGRRSEARALVRRVAARFGAESSPENSAVKTPAGERSDARTLKRGDLPSKTAAELAEEFLRIREERDGHVQKMDELDREFLRRSPAAYGGLGLFLFAGVIAGGWMAKFQGPANGGQIASLVFLGAFLTGTAWAIYRLAPTTRPYADLKKYDASLSADLRQRLKFLLSRMGIESSGKRDYWGVDTEVMGDVYSLLESSGRDLIRHKERVLEKVGTYRRFLNRYRFPWSPARRLELELGMRKVAENYENLVLAAARAAEASNYSVKKHWVDEMILAGDGLQSAVDRFLEKAGPSSANRSEGRSGNKRLEVVRGLGMQFGNLSYQQVADYFLPYEGWNALKLGGLIRTGASASPGQPNGYAFQEEEERIVRRALRSAADGPSREIFLTAFAPGEGWELRWTGLTLKKLLQENGTSGETVRVILTAFDKSFEGLQKLDRGMLFWIEEENRRESARKVLFEYRGFYGDFKNRDLWENMTKAVPPSALIFLRNSGTRLDGGIEEWKELSRLLWERVTPSGALIVGESAWNYDVTTLNELHAAEIKASENQPPPLKIARSETRGTPSGEIDGQARQELLEDIERQLVQIAISSGDGKRRILRDDKNFTVRAEFVRLNRFATVLVSLVPEENRVRITGYSDLPLGTDGFQVQALDAEGEVIPGVEAVAGTFTLEMEVSLDGEWQGARKQVLDAVRSARIRLWQHLYPEAMAAKMAEDAKAPVTDPSSFAVPSADDIIRFYEQHDENGWMPLPSGAKVPVGMLQLDPRILQWYRGLINDFGRNLNILSIGSGRGQLEKALQDDGHDVTAVDISRKNAEYSKKLGVETVVADAHKPLGLKKEYDLIVVVDSAGQTDPPVLFENLKDYLREGGHIFVSTPRTKTPMTQREYEDSKFIRYSRAYIDAALQLAGYDVLSGGLLPLGMAGDPRGITLEYHTARLPAARSEGRRDPRSQHGLTASAVNRSEGRRDPRSQHGLTASAVNRSETRGQIQAGTEGADAELMRRINETAAEIAAAINTRANRDIEVFYYFSGDVPRLQVLAAAGVRQSRIRDQPRPDLGTFAVRHARRYAGPDAALEMSIHGENIILHEPGKFQYREEFAVQLDPPVRKKQKKESSGSTIRKRRPTASENKTQKVARISGFDEVLAGWDPATSGPKIPAYDEILAAINAGDVPKARRLYTWHRNALAPEELKLLKQRIAGMNAGGGAKRSEIRADGEQDQPSGGFDPVDLTARAAEMQHMLYLAQTLEMEEEALENPATQFKASSLFWFNYALMFASFILAAAAAVLFWYFGIHDSIAGRFGWLTLVKMGAAAIGTWIGYFMMRVARRVQKEIDVEAWLESTGMENSIQTALPGLETGDEAVPAELPAGDAVYPAAGWDLETAVNALISFWDLNMVVFIDKDYARESIGITRRFQLLKQFTRFRRYFPSAEKGALTKLLNGDFDRTGRLEIQLTFDPHDGSRPRPVSFVFYAADYLALSSAHLKREAPRGFGLLISKNPGSGGVMARASGQGKAFYSRLLGSAAARGSLLYIKKAALPAHDAAKKHGFKIISGSENLKALFSGWQAGRSDVLANAGISDRQFVWMRKGPGRRSEARQTNDASPSVDVVIDSLKTEQQALSEIRVLSDKDFQDTAAQYLPLVVEAAEYVSWKTSSRRRIYYDVVRRHSYDFIRVVGNSAMHSVHVIPKLTEDDGKKLVDEIERRLPELLEKKKTQPREYIREQLPVFERQIQKLSDKVAGAESVPWETAKSVLLQAQELMEQLEELYKLSTGNVFFEEAASLQRLAGRLRAVQSRASGKAPGIVPPEGESSGERSETRNAAKIQRQEFYEFLNTMPLQDQESVLRLILSIVQGHYARQSRPSRIREITNAANRLELSANAQAAVTQWALHEHRWNRPDWRESLADEFGGTLIDIGEYFAGMDAFIAEEISDRLGSLSDKSKPDGRSDMHTVEKSEKSNSGEGDPGKSLARSGLNQVIAGLGSKTDKRIGNDEREALLTARPAAVEGIFRRAGIHNRQHVAAVSTYLDTLRKSAGHEDDAPELPRGTYSLSGKNEILRPEIFPSINGVSTENLLNISIAYGLSNYGPGMGTSVMFRAGIKPRRGAEIAYIGAGVAASAVNRSEARIADPANLAFAQAVHSIDETSPEGYQFLHAVRKLFENYAGSGLNEFSQSMKIMDADGELLRAAKTRVRRDLANLENRIKDRLGDAAETEVTGGYEPDDPFEAAELEAYENMQIMNPAILAEVAEMKRDAVLKEYLENLFRGMDEDHLENEWLIQKVREELTVRLGYFKVRQVNEKNVPAVNPAFREDVFQEVAALQKKIQTEMMDAAEEDAVTISDVNGKLIDLVERGFARIVKGMLQRLRALRAEKLKGLLSEEYIMRYENLAGRAEARTAADASVRQYDPKPDVSGQRQAPSSVHGLTASAVNRAETRTAADASVRQYDPKPDVSGQRQVPSSMHGLTASAVNRAETRTDSNDKRKGRLLKEVLVAAGLIGIYSLCNLLVYLPVTQPWVDVTPLRVAIGAAPIAALNGLIGGYMAQRIRKNIVLTDEIAGSPYDWRQIGRQSLLGAVFGAPIFAFFVMGWAIRLIPGIAGWVPAAVVQAFVNQFVLAPLLFDPMNYFVGKMVIAKKSFRQTVLDARKELPRFVGMAAVIWFPTNILALSFDNPLITYFVITVAGLVWSAVFGIFAGGSGVVKNQTYKSLPFRILHYAYDRPGLGVFALSVTYWFYIAQIARMFYVLEPGFLWPAAAAGLGALAWIMTLRADSRRLWVEDPEAAGHVGRRDLLPDTGRRSESRMPVHPRKNPVRSEARKSHLPAYESLIQLQMNPLDGWYEPIQRIIDSEPATVVWNKGTAADNRVAAVHMAIEQNVFRQHFRNVTIETIPSDPAQSPLLKLDQSTQEFVMGSLRRKDDGWRLLVREDVLAFSPEELKQFLSMAGWYLKWLSENGRLENLANEKDPEKIYGQLRSLNEQALQALMPGFEMSETPDADGRGTLWERIESRFLMPGTTSRNNAETAPVTQVPEDLFEGPPDYVQSHLSGRAPGEMFLVREIAEPLDNSLFPDFAGWSDEVAADSRLIRGRSLYPPVHQLFQIGSRQYIVRIKADGYVDALGRAQPPDADTTYFGQGSPSFHLAVDAFARARVELHDRQPLGAMRESNRVHEDRMSREFHRRGFVVNLPSGYITRARAGQLFDGSPTESLIQLVPVKAVRRLFHEMQFRRWRMGGLAHRRKVDAAAAEMFSAGELIEKFAAFLSRIHRAGLIHGYPHLNNFSFLPDENNFVAHDLDNARDISGMSLDEALVYRLQDVRAALVSVISALGSAGDIEIYDYVASQKGWPGILDRFLRGYLGPEPFARVRQEDWTPPVLMKLLMQDLRFQPAHKINHPVIRTLTEILRSEGFEPLHLDAGVLEENPPLEYPMLIPKKAGRDELIRMLFIGNFNVPVYSRPEEVPTDILSLQGNRFRTTQKPVLPILESMNQGELSEYVPMININGVVLTPKDSLLHRELLDRQAIRDGAVKTSAVLLRLIREVLKDNPQRPSPLNLEAVNEQAAAVLAGDEKFPPAVERIKRVYHDTGWKKIQLATVQRIAERIRGLWQRSQTRRSEARQNPGQTSQDMPQISPMVLRYQAKAPLRQRIKTVIGHLFGRKTKEPSLSEAVQLRLNFDAEDYEQYVAGLSRKERGEFESRMIAVIADAVRDYERSGEWRKYYRINRQGQIRRDFIDSTEELTGPLGVLAQVKFFDPHVSARYFVNRILRPHVLEKDLETGNPRVPVLDLKRGTPAAVMKENQRMIRLAQDMTEKILERYLSGDVWAPSLAQGLYSNKTIPYRWRRVVLKLNTLMSPEFVENLISTVVISVTSLALAGLLAALRYILNFEHVLSFLRQFTVFEFSKINVDLLDIFFAVILVRLVFRAFLEYIQKKMERIERSYYRQIFDNYVLGITTEVRRAAFQEFESDYDHIEHVLSQGDSFEKTVLRQIRAVLLDAGREKQRYVRFIRAGRLLLESNLDADETDVWSTLLSEALSQNPDIFKQYTDFWKSRRGWSLFAAKALSGLTFGRWPIMKKTVWQRLLDLIPLTEMQQHDNYRRLFAEDQAGKNFVRDKKNAGSVSSGAWQRMIADERLKLTGLESDAYHEFFINKFVRKLLTQIRGARNRRTVLLSYFAGSVAARLEYLEQTFRSGHEVNQAYALRIFQMAEAYWPGILDKIERRRNYQAEFGISSGEIENLRGIIRTAVSRAKEAQRILEEKKNGTAQRSETRGRQDRINIKNIRIIIADDNSANYRKIRRELLKAGASTSNITMIDDVDEVVRALDQIEGPHIVILDIVFNQHMDGFEILDDLKPKKNSRVVIMSSDYNRQIRQLGDQYRVKFPQTGAVIDRAKIDHNLIIPDSKLSAVFDRVDSMEWVNQAIVKLNELVAGRGIYSSEIDEYVPYGELAENKKNRRLYYRIWQHFNYFKTSIGRQVKTIRDEVESHWGQKGFQELIVDGLITYRLGAPIGVYEFGMNPETKIGWGRGMFVPEDQRGLDFGYQTTEALVRHLVAKGYKEFHVGNLELPGSLLLSEDEWTQRLSERILDRYRDAMIPGSVIKKNSGVIQKYAIDLEKTAALSEANIDTAEISINEHLTILAEKNRRIVSSNTVTVYLSWADRGEVHFYINRRDNESCREIALLIAAVIRDETAGWTENDWTNGDANQKLSRIITKKLNLEKSDRSEARVIELTDEQVLDRFYEYWGSSFPLDEKERGIYRNFLTKKLPLEPSMVVLAQQSRLKTSTAEKSLQEAQAYFEKLNANRKIRTFENADLAQLVQAARRFQFNLEGHAELRADEVIIDLLRDVSYIASFEFDLDPRTTDEDFIRSVRQMLSHEDRYQRNYFDGPLMLDADDFYKAYQKVRPGIRAEVRSDSANQITRRKMLRHSAAGAATVALWDFSGPEAQAQVPDRVLLPANSKSNPDVRAILAYLQSLPSRKDKRVISGQFIGHPQPDAQGAYDAQITTLKESSGQWVGIAGADYARINGATEAADVAALNRVLIEHWKKGGLVTVSWHAPNPWTGGGAKDKTLTS